MSCAYITTNELGIRKRFTYTNTYCLNKLWSY